VSWRIETRAPAADHGKHRQDTQSIGWHTRDVDLQPEASPKTRRSVTMSRILQINFKYSVPRAEYERAVASMADPISKVAGLQWKIWILNEKESEAGGIYHFDSEASADAYLQGPIVAQVVRHPALGDFQVKQFDVMPEVTTVTRGPVR
jgi:Putative mono-oxygenase ydhR